MLLSCFSIRINVFYRQMLAGFFLLCNWDVTAFVRSVFLTESCLWGVTVDRILCTIKGKTDPQTDTSSNGITRSSSSLLGMNHLTVSVKPCLSKLTFKVKTTIPSDVKATSSIFTTRCSGATSLSMGQWSRFLSDGHVRSSDLSSLHCSDKHFNNKNICVQ